MFTKALGQYIIILRTDCSIMDCITLSGACLTAGGGFHSPAPEHRSRATAQPEPKKQVDFLAETDHFIHALKEGLKSLVGGLELRGMDSETRESSEGLDTRNFSQVRLLVRARSSSKVQARARPCATQNIFKYTFVRSA